MHTTSKPKTHEFSYRGKRILINTRCYEDEKGFCFSYSVSDPDLSDIDFGSEEEALEAAKARIRKHYDR